MYHVKLSKQADKALRKMPRQEAQRIGAALYRLAADPDEATNAKPLTGRLGEFRLRVGDWRVIYRLERQLLLVQVIKIGSRGDIYNG